ncbi:MAG: LuxR family transcriptional regulator [Propionibacterium sp.]|nr:LuxR family transcriptional regulator [Propionibacterium sp.]
MAATPPPGTIGPTTQFVGRHELLGQVVDSVRRERLTTLVGPGGIGKTRLSLEVERRTADRFADGSTVITLDSVLDQDDVAWRAASQLSASDQSRRTATEHVVRHLADQELLLIVDNCEHVLDAAADLVLAILQRCPRVHVLTTSLGPLGLSSEYVIPVPPLGVPDSGAGADSVADSEAVRLLLQRAAQIGVMVEVTDDNAAAVTELCQHLDGMPLAIELAAVRLRSLSVPDLLRRIDERFSLLRGTRDALPRHQTLSALVDWSFDLCTPDEQLLWTRMSVFLDGCDLTAAETVCGFGELDAGLVADLLDNLVSKSIVNAQPTGTGMRYRMLVTIREYGVRRSEEAGEWDEVRLRHRDHYVQRARDMVSSWSGPLQARSMCSMRTERANIMVALEWSLSVPEERPRAAELASSLRYQWVSGRFLSDGRYRIDRILATEEVTGRIRGEALWVAAWVCLIQGDHSQGDAYLGELEVLAEELDDAMLRAHFDHWTGLSLLFHGWPAQGADRYRAAIETFRAAGDEAAWQTALFQYGLCQIYSGDLPGALESQTELIALSEANGEQWCRAYGYWVRGVALHHAGDLAGALTAADTALALQDEFEDAICIAHTLLLLSSVAVACEDFPRAGGFHAAADALWRSMGTRISSFGPGMAGDAGAARMAIQRALGEDEWHRMQELEGNGRDLAEVVRWARDELAALVITPPAPGREPLPGVRLTKREAEVAGLLARGMSNKDIAGALTISIRTAEGHVEQVLKKLGATSRAQAATMLVRGSG